VIVFPKRFYLWNVADASEIKPHTLELLNFVKPRPDYLIIGTGEKSISLDFTFYEHFRRMGITVDSCPSVINNSNSFDIYFSLRHVVHLTCAMKTGIMWHGALVQPRVSDEAGRNPRAESAPDNNEHKPSQTLIS
jgi:hypothetical protein